MSQLVLFESSRPITITSAPNGYQPATYRGVPIEQIDWLDVDPSDNTRTIAQTAIGVPETWDGDLMTHLRAIYALGGKLGVCPNRGVALVLGMRQAEVIK